MSTLFFQLWVKKLTRSVSFGRNLIWYVILGFIILYLLTNLIFVAAALPFMLRKTLTVQDPVQFINSNLLFFFLVEFGYRYFIQRLPVIELEHFLHLPIARSKIVNYLLLRSYLSPLSVIALIIFTPFSIIEIGGQDGIIWLFTIVMLSLSMHTFILWFKQKYGDSILVLMVLAAVGFMAFGADYFDLLNAGNFFAPFFALAQNSIVPLLVAIVLCGASYYLAFNYYKTNAYTEDLSNGEKHRFNYRSLGFLSRFGLAGEMAELEWRLILRHKKSRSYLLISALFILYGLFIYIDPDQSEGGLPWMYVFMGIFITGSFMLQYGQLFLSWNSSYFDFFLNRHNGVKALVQGKYLLLMILSILFFFLTIPYVYFGRDIILINLACLMFNLGITSQMIISFAIWKPKPMDLSKGAFMNYEGTGAAQFLMAFPVIILPFVIYLPFSLWYNDYVGLMVLSAVGVIGLLLKDKILQHSINRILKNKYEISASFRQEL